MPQDTPQLMVSSLTSLHLKHFLSFLSLFQNDLQLSTQILNKSKIGMYVANF